MTSPTFTSTTEELIKKYKEIKQGCDGRFDIEYKGMILNCCCGQLGQLTNRIHYCPKCGEKLKIETARIEQKLSSEKMFLDVFEDLYFGQKRIPFYTEFVKKYVDDLKKSIALLEGALQ